jgi:hypothetical protein
LAAHVVLVSWVAGPHMHNFALGDIKLHSPSLG